MRPRHRTNHRGPSHYYYYYYYYYHYHYYHYYCCYYYCHWIPNWTRTSWQRPYYARSSHPPPMRAHPDSTTSLRIAP
ncbi:MAG TPA: hypothetical protein VI299_18750 [Polyangiales bacterium]